MIFEIRYKEYNFVEGLTELKFFIPDTYHESIQSLFTNFSDYFYFIGGHRCETKDKEGLDFFFADKNCNYYKFSVNTKREIRLQESTEEETLEICVDLFKDTSIENWILDRIAYIKKPILIKNF